MLTFKNEDARGLIKKNLGAEAGAEVKDLDFLPFSKLEDAVQDDVQWLRAQKVIADDIKISGWVYEVETGKVKRVG